MKGAHSAALVGRYGLSFVRVLKERFDKLIGVATANCWWTGFSETGEYDPVLGYGYVLKAQDGLSVKIWVWVDDFLIHGLTYEKTA